MTRHCLTRNRAAMAWLVAAGSLILCGACPGPRAKDRDPATAPPDLATASAGGPAPAPGDGPATLAALCRRASERVQGQLAGYRRQFIRAGLSPPARVALEVRPAAAPGMSPQRRVVAGYVARQLAGELGHAGDLAVSLESRPGPGAGASLTVDAVTDFDMPFDSIGCSLHLCLERCPPLAWSDRFSDHGLVFVDGPKTAKNLVVSVAGETLRLDFPACPKQWYVLPRGRYMISMRCDAGGWPPQSMVIGSQVFLDMSRPPAAAGPGEPSGRDARSPTAVGRSGIGRSEFGQPPLRILTPVHGARVSRIITVRGTGLAGATVSCTVSVGQESYVQDARCRIADDRTWDISNVVIGRVGSIDAGTRFQIRVQARMPGNTSVESEPITVERQ